MDARSKLFLQKDLYDLNHTNGLFFDAVKENVRWHFSNCLAYRELLHTQGFSIEHLETYEDLEKLPPIPTLFLKKHELFSLPPSKIHMKSTTSGTSGAPVSVGLDASSMVLGLNMLRKTLHDHHLASPVPTNNIILGYQPSKRNKMGAVRTAYGATFLTPALHREYALIDKGDRYALNEEGIMKALHQYSQSRWPIRINGFSAYLYFLLKKLEEQKIKFTFHPKSLIFLGGGWKQYFAQKVDKQELYRMAEERLGIPESRFREFFGVVEHNIPYCDCKNHHFHVPVYSRVIIRDIHTLKPVPHGKQGLLNLITPLLKSMPLTSILTDDIAVMHDGRDCGCEISSPYFEILGRAGLEGIKTCTAGAGSLLEAMR